MAKQDKRSLEDIFGTGKRGTERIPARPLEEIFGMRKDREEPAPAAAASMAADSGLRTMSDARDVPATDSGLVRTPRFRGEKKRAFLEQSQRMMDGWLEEQAPASAETGGVPWLPPAVADAGQTVTEAVPAEKTDRRRSAERFDAGSLLNPAAVRSGVLLDPQQGAAPSEGDVVLPTGTVLRKSDRDMDDFFRRQVVPGIDTVQAKADERARKILHEQDEARNRLWLEHFNIDPVGDFVAEAVRTEATSRRERGPARIVEEVLSGIDPDEANAYIAEHLADDEEFARASARLEQVLPPAGEVTDREVEQLQAALTPAQRRQFDKAVEAERKLLAGEQKAFQQAADAAWRRQALRLQQGIADRLVEEMARRNMPNSELAALGRIAVDASVPGMLSELAVSNAAGGDKALHARIMQRAMEKYDPAMATRIGGEVAGLLLSAPVFSAGGAIGKAGAAGLRRIAERSVMKRLIERGITGGAEGVARRLVARNTAQRLAQGAVTSGTTLATYDAVATPLALAAAGETPGLGDVFGAAARGFATGALLPGIGMATGRIADATGSRLGRYAAEAGGFAAENAAFVGMGTLYDGIRTGEWGSPEQLAGDFAHSVGVLGIMKSIGALKRGRAKNPGFYDKVIAETEFTPEEVEALGRAGVDGRSYKRAVFDLLNAKPTEAGRAVAERAAERLGSRYTDIMRSGEVPVSAKAKLMFLVEGRIPERLPLTTDVRRTVGEDGRTTVELLDPAGNLVQRRTFSSEKAAEAFERESAGMREINTIQYYEALIDRVQSLEEASAAYAAERGVRIEAVKEEVRKAAGGRPHDRETVRRVVELAGQTDSGTADVPGMLVEQVVRKYGLGEGGLERALTLKESARTPEQRAAVAEYAARLKEVATQELRTERTAEQQAEHRLMQVAEEAIERTKNRDDDVVYTATMRDGRQVNIIKGAGLSYDPETGEVDAAQSEPTVVVRYDDGTMRQVSVRDIDMIVEAVHAQDARTQALDAVREQLEAAARDEALSDAVGSGGMVALKDGRIGAVEGVNEDGSYSIALEDGEGGIVTEQVAAADIAGPVMEEMTETTGQNRESKAVGRDASGNPVDADGKLVYDKLRDLAEIADEEFDTPIRNVSLPTLPSNVATALGAQGKEVIIKKSVFEKNRDNHPELDASESRNILRKALYDPNLVGATQPVRRPDYRVAIHTGEMNSVVVLDVYETKDHVEIVGWRRVNAKGLDRMKKQAAREDGQLLILSPEIGSAAALSALPHGWNENGKLQYRVYGGPQSEQGQPPVSATTSPTDAGVGNKDTTSIPEKQVGNDPLLGRPLTEEEAAQVVEGMEAAAVPVPQVELTPENWDAAFGEDGKVQTPIGEVKMGENQYLKMLKNDRGRQFGMVKPTLTEPDVIIEDASEATDGITERSSSYVFIKTFLKPDGQTLRFFTSVTVNRDGMEVVVSNHLKNKKRINNLLKNGKLQYRVYGGPQTEQNRASASVTTPQTYPGVGSKDTTSIPEKQAERADIPRLKDGRPDFNAMPAEMLAVELSEALGHDRAVERLQAARGANGKRLEKLRKALEGMGDLNKAMAAELRLGEMQREDVRLAGALEQLGAVEPQEAETNTSETFSQEIERLFPEGLPNVRARVLADIARGQRFIWSDSSDGTKRGVARELGFTGNESERRARFGILGSERTGAKYVSSYVHELWQDSNGYAFDMDDAQLRDEVIDVLLGAPSRKAAMEQLRDMAVRSAEDAAAPRDAEDAAAIKAYDEMQKSLRRSGNYGTFAEGVTQPEMYGREFDKNHGRGFSAGPDTGIGMVDDPAGGMARVGDRSDIRVFEEGLAASYREHSDGSERDRREAESERLVAAAKENGLYIAEEQLSGYGKKQSAKTGESVVYIDRQNGKVYKSKNPYAKAAIKGNAPEDAIYEHIVHNLLFPETRYEFEGISDYLGDVRIVLSQDFVHAVNLPTQQQIGDELARRGLLPEDRYSYGNELVSVTDVEGDNVLAGYDGRLYFIDPIIRLKRPAREVIAELERREPTQLGDSPDERVDDWLDSDVPFSVRSVSAAAPAGVTSERWNVIVEQLRGAVGAENVVTDPEQVRSAYERIMRHDEEVRREHAEGADMPFEQPEQPAPEVADTRYFRTPAGEVYGFTSGGKIYLDGTRMNAATPMHEYTELWSQIVARKQPALWARGVELMKQTETWRQVNADPNYTRLSEELRASETLSRIAAGLFDERQAGITDDRGLFDRLRDWLRDFWNALKETFSKWTQKRLEDLSPDDFARMPLRDFVEGIDLKEYLRERNSARPAEIAKNRIREKAQTDGTYLKAPNGKPSRLTADQWETVRTPQFKEWFGDWENDPENASKVVDENGEPQVMYHGSQEHFHEFSGKYMGKNGTGWGQGFYFTPDKSLALDYSKNGGVLFETFLNIRKPLSTDKKSITRLQFKKFIDRLDRFIRENDPDGIDLLSDYGDISRDGRTKILNEAVDLEYPTAESDVELVGGLINVSGNYHAVETVLKRTLGYDGIIAPNGFEYVVTNPTDIKSATENNGAFDPANPDIRFNFIGKKDAAGIVEARPFAERRVTTLERLENKRAALVADRENIANFEERLAAVDTKIEAYGRVDHVAGTYGDNGAEAQSEAHLRAVEDAVYDMQREMNIPTPTAIVRNADEFIARLREMGATNEQMAGISLEHCPNGIQWRGEIVIRGDVITDKAHARVTYLHEQAHDITEALFTPDELYDAAEEMGADYMNRRLEKRDLAYHVDGDSDASMIKGANEMISRGIELLYGKGVLDEFFATENGPVYPVIMYLEEHGVPPRLKDLIVENLQNIKADRYGTERTRRNIPEGVEEQLYSRLSPAREGNGAADETSGGAGATGHAVPGSIGTGPAGITADAGGRTGGRGGDLDRPKFAIAERRVTTLERLENKRAALVADRENIANFEERLASVDAEIEAYNGVDHVAATYREDGSGAESEVHLRAVEDAVYDMQREMNIPTQTEVVPSRVEFIARLREMGATDEHLDGITVDHCPRGVQWRSTILIRSDEIKNREDARATYLHEQAHDLTEALFTQEEMYAAAEEMGTEYMNLRLEGLDKSYHVDDENFESVVAGTNELISRAVEILYRKGLLNAFFATENGSLHPIIMALEDSFVPTRLKNLIIENLKNIKADKYGTERTRQETGTGNSIRRSDERSGRQDRGMGDIFHDGIGTDAEISGRRDERGGGSEKSRDSLRIINKPNYSFDGLDESSPRLTKQQQLIADLRRAVRETKASARAVAQIVSRRVRSEVGRELVEAMGKREFDAIIGQIEQATARQEVEKPLRRIAEVVVDIRIKRLQKAVDDFLRLKVQGEGPRGVSVAKEVDDRTRRMFEIFRQNLDRPAAEVAEELREAEDADRLYDMDAVSALEAYQEAQRYSREVDEIDREADALRSRNTQLRRERIAANKVGHKELFETLKKQIAYNNELIEALEEERMQTKEHVAGYLKETAGMLSEKIGYGREILHEWKEQEQERRKDIVRKAFADVDDGNRVPVLDKQPGVWTQGYRRTVDFLLSPAYSMDYLLKMISVNAPKGEGALYDHFMRGKDGYVEARGRYWLGYEEFKRLLDEKARRVFGKSYMQVVADSNAPTEATIRITNALPRKQNRNKGAASGDKEPEELIVEEEYNPTIGEALYIYMADKMTDGRVKLRRMGITETQIDALAGILPPRYIQFADWIQAEFLPERRKRYNETHLAVFGTQMARIENYVPLKVQKSNVRQEVDGSEPDPDTLPSAITGSIIKRTRNNQILNLHTNALDLMLEHGQQMEHWNAFTRVVLDMNALLSSTAFRRTLEARNPGLHRRLKVAAQLAADSYRPQTNDVNRAWIALGKLAASSKIAFRINTALKQMLSYPAFYAYSPDRKFWGLLTKNLVPTTWTKNFRWCLDYIPSFRERWLGRMAGNEKLAQMTAPMLDRWIAKMNRYGMLPNAFVDALTCANGAKAVYDFRRAEYMERGRDAAEAERLARIDAAVAINSTQQSSEGMFIGQMQADRDFWSVSLSTFQNSNFAYLRKQLEGIDELFRDAVRERTNRAAYYREQGLTDAEAFDLALAEVMQAKRGALLNIGVFVFVLNLLWALGNNVWKYLFAPETRAEIPEELLKSAFISPVRNTTVGSLAESFANGYDANPSVLLSDMIAFTRRLKRIAERENPDAWNETAAYLALQTLSANGLGIDLESFVNMYQGITGMIRDGADVEDLMRMLNAPQSQAKLLAGKPREGETPEQYRERMIFTERRIAARVDKRRLDKWSRNYSAYRKAGALGLRAERDRFGNVAVPELKELDADYQAALKQSGVTAAGDMRKEYDWQALTPEQQERWRRRARLAWRIYEYEKDLDTVVLFDERYAERMRELMKLKREYMEDVERDK